MDRVVIRSWRRRALGVGALIVIWAVAVALVATDDGPPRAAVIAGASVLSAAALSIMVRSTTVTRDAITLRRDLLRRRVIPSSEVQRIRMTRYEIWADLLDGAAVRLPGTDDGMAFAHHTERRVPRLYSAIHDILGR